MTADVELLPLPEAMIKSYQTDSTMRTMTLHSYSEFDMQAYARANVAHATAAKDAEIARWKEMAEWQGAMTKALLRYQDEAVAGRAEIEALRAEVETLRDGLDYLRQMQGVPDVLELRAKAARAERLAEALRDARDYVTTALREEREKFAGHEDCSDIPGIEADLHKIDTLLREQENDDA